MTRFVSQLFAIVIMFIAFSKESAGQTAFELGLDLGVRADANGSNFDIVTTAIPLNLLRVGVHLGNRFSIEPTVSLMHTDTENDITVTNFETSVALLYHFGTTRTRTRFYVMAGVPFAFARIADEKNSFDDSTFGVLGGIGVLFPIEKQFAIRVQVRWNAFFNSRNSIFGLVGFSFFIE